MRVPAYESCSQPSHHHRQHKLDTSSSRSARWWRQPRPQRRRLEHLRAAGHTGAASLSAPWPTPWRRAAAAAVAVVAMVEMAPRTTAMRSSSSSSSTSGGDGSGSGGGAEGD